RTQNRGTLKHRRCPGNRVWEDLFWYQLGKKRTTDRGVKGAYDTQNDENNKNKRNRANRSRCGEQKQSKAHSVADVAKHDEFSAIIAVCNMPGNKEQENSRQKLR